MKIEIQVELKNEENLSFKMKKVEIMALLREADSCSTCSPVPNKKQMKGLLVGNKSLHSL